MPAANALTLIRENVQTIVAWDELTDVVAAEDIQLHDRDVDIRPADGGSELAGRRIDVRLSQRSFRRFSSHSWGFSLRFVVRIRVDHLPVANLEAIEWLIIRAVTFLDAGLVPGTATALTATTPAIVEEYLVADIDPELDVNSIFEEGWESVVAIVVNGTIDFASLMED